MTNLMHKVAVGATFIMASFVLRPALAQTPEPAKQAESATKEEVEALRRDVNAMKKTLEELLELDRRRVEVLTRGLEGGASTLPDGSKTPAKPASSAPSTGTIVGKVQAPGGIAFVFVEDIPGRMLRGKKVVIEQVAKQYRPRWAVVRRGTEVEFPNRDTIYHNVFSRSPGNAFDLGIYRSGDPTKAVALVTPGVVDVFCNMHPEMSASILVVPNSYYTRTKADGSFRLVVPSGRRRLAAWAPFAEPKVEVVQVGQGETTVNFQLTPRPTTHLNKHGQPYGSYE